MRAHQTYRDSEGNTVHLLGCSGCAEDKEEVFEEEFKDLETHTCVWCQQGMNPDLAMCNGCWEEQKTKASDRIAELEATIETMRNNWIPGPQVATRELAGHDPRTGTTRAANPKTEIAPNEKS